MTIHDQTEQAYKNGYEAGRKETMDEIIEVIQDYLPSDKFSDRYILLATIITEILKKYKELKK